MFWGFILTIAALAFVLICSGRQIFRVDRTIRQVDAELKRSGGDGDG